MKPQTITKVVHGIAFRPGRLAVFALALGILSSAAQTPNAVSNVGLSAYNINGTNNATLTLMRGVTYLFNINASGHPFWIKSVAGIGTGNAYPNGVTGNGIQVGTLTFAVPTNAPDTLFYNCQFHSAMKGTLNIINPPSPPVVRIVSISVGNAVVVASTGTAGWSPVPEYCCELPPTNWTTVSTFTNVFANGTNTTSFDRLEPICGPSVFIRVREQQN
jgi:hypothetical protein